jgi:hypothetical protein
MLLTAAIYFGQNEQATIAAKLGDLAPVVAA